MDSMETEIVLKETRENYGFIPVSNSGMGSRSGCRYAENLHRRANRKGSILTS